MATLFARVLVGSSSLVTSTSPATTTLAISAPNVENTMNSSLRGGNLSNRVGWGHRGSPIQNGTLLITTDGVHFDSQMLTNMQVVDQLAYYIEQQTLQVVDLAAPGVPLTRANLVTLYQAN